MGVIPRIKEMWDGNVPMFRHKLMKLLSSDGVSSSERTNPYIGMVDSTVNPYSRYTKDSTSAGTEDVFSGKPENVLPQEQYANSGGDTAVKTVSDTEKTGSDTVKTEVPYTPKETQSVVPQSDSNIVSAAEKYLGTPYVWGGESMAEGGMDCSGFVYNSLRDAGYDVGRTTANGYRGYGQAISKSDLQPGDLVFYGKNGKASHIGIYVGDGQIIHSTGDVDNTKENPGKGVTITNIDYRGDFIEARRC